MVILAQNIDSQDLVWVHLRKEDFLSFRKYKLQHKIVGPFQVLENIRVIVTFNISDLTFFYISDDELNSRTSSSEERVMRTQKKSKDNKWCNY